MYEYEADVRTCEAGPSSKYLRHLLRQDTKLTDTAFDFPLVSRRSISMLPVHDNDFVLKTDEKIKRKRRKRRKKLEVKQEKEK